MRAEFWDIGTGRLRRRALAGAVGLALAAAAGGCGGKARPVARPQVRDPEGVFEPHALRAVMAGVAARRMGAISGPVPAQATLAAGLLALAAISEDPAYLGAVRAAGERHGWRPAARRAEDGGLGAVWLQLYLVERDRRTVARTLQQLETLIGRQDFTVDVGGLALTVPALALAASATGDALFADAAARLFGRSAPGLLDPAESLFFRHPSERSGRERNGRRAFAARDTAQALDGLVRLLEHLPDGHVMRRPLEHTYRRVAAKVAELQRGDGAWRARLLDPESAPTDVVATGLFVHALAWGIERGLLERGALLPTVRRGWSALAAAARQGHDLGPEEAGAVLLAGAEVFRLKVLEGSTGRTIVARNTVPEARPDETLELAWAPLVDALRVVPGDPLVVVDERSGAFLPFQLFDGDGDGRDETLLVATSFLDGESRRITVRRLARPFRAPAPRARAHGRFPPGARQDLAWENDRIAFRVWGPDAPGGSSGIDVWTKRVRAPVIDRWYNPTPPPDEGELRDFYDVGPSRGCGGLGLWEANRLHVSRPFRSWRVLARGPVRVAFELSFDAWGPPEARVEETKRISLDLGQHLNRIESRFRTEKARLPLAVGIVRRQAEGHVARDVPSTWLSYWQPPQGPRGELGCGVVLERQPRDPEARYQETEDHFLLITDHPADRPFVYHAGGCWSQGSDFQSADQWSLHMAALSRRFGSPILLEPLDHDASP